jgi:hypothetical protein
LKNIIVLTFSCLATYFAASCGDNSSPPYCGFESEVAPAGGEEPPLPPGDTQFRADGHTGYVSVDDTADGKVLRALLDCHTSGCAEPRKVLGLYSSSDPKVRFAVHDVIVQDKRLHVLWQMFTYADDPSQDASQLYLATLDVEQGGRTDMWMLGEVKIDGSDEYRLAVDGKRLMLGHYDLETGELFSQTMPSMGSDAGPGPEIPVSEAPDRDWSYGHLLSFEADRGAVTFRILSDDYAKVRTTRFGLCD